MIEEITDSFSGHTLIPFSPPDVPEIYRLFVCAVCVDGGAYLMNLMDNVSGGYAILHNTVFHTSPAVTQTFQEYKIVDPNTE